jgi:hypothetical protein
MDLRYLLYIDILGFSELVATSPEKVDDLYTVIASLGPPERPLTRRLQPVSRLTPARSR